MTLQANDPFWMSCWPDILRWYHVMSYLMSRFKWWQIIIMLTWMDVFVESWLINYVLNKYHVSDWILILTISDKIKNSALGVPFLFFLYSQSNYLQSCCTGPRHSLGGCRPNRLQYWRWRTSFCGAADTGMTSPTSTIEYGHESGGCLLLPLQ